MGIKAEPIAIDPVLNFKPLSLGKRKSKMKVFFTETKDRIFFAETTCTRTKTPSKYKALSPFGTSVVFMFWVTPSGKVDLIRVSKLDNM